MLPRTLTLVLAGFLSLAAACAGTANAQQDDAMHQGPAMNFHRINSRLATAGHLLDDGAVELANQGVTLVINLRDDPPVHEKEQFEAAGIRWVNVPVVWQKPERADLDSFAELMAANENESILVQCQANYRASSMTYLYRVTRLGVSESEARKDLDAVWTPSGTWRAYIDEILVSSEAPEETRE